MGRLVKTYTDESNSVAAQVFVVVAAGSVIAFIIRDLGDAPLAGWIIQVRTVSSLAAWSHLINTQGPLLMQAVLSPIVGRLSDVLDRKMLATVPPLLAFVGAVISAKATSMVMLIVGGILIGTTLSTISIVQAIPSEILPLKYRPIAQGLAGMGGTIGGLQVLPIPIQHGNANGIHANSLLTSVSPTESVP